jgi:Amidohydrolase
MTCALRHRLLVLAVVFSGSTWQVQAQASNYQTNDAHFHLTNYIQEGIDIHDFLKIMGATRTGRVALFGIPLQQDWEYGVSGDRAPKYYLDTDSPLYYYSFTDAYIATAYKSLTKEEQARFDPMITGFNPADMYAADHVRRVLQTFPGVFSGIGEFSIHKEFVTSKIAGETPSLQDKALDRLLDFAGEVGLLVIIHNDMDIPFATYGTEPVYLKQMQDLIKRHPNTTIIWAHTGLGRVVRPVQNHAATLAAMLSDPAYKNLYFDISWSVMAQYVTSSPDATKITADLLNRFPDRFLYGSDTVAPRDTKQYESVFVQYGPLWSLLTPEASEKVRKGNYERLFDQARTKVRTWEAAHAH